MNYYLNKLEEAVKKNKYSPFDYHLVGDRVCYLQEGHDGEHVYQRNIYPDFWQTQE